MTQLPDEFENSNFLEKTELLAGVAEHLVGDNLQDVETNRLGERAALAGGDDVTILDGVEGGGAVNRDVAVTLLETVVLLDVVQIMLAHDNGVLHLVGDAHT